MTWPWQKRDPLPWMGVNTPMVRRQRELLERETNEELCAVIRISHTQAFKSRNPQKRAEWTAKLWAASELLEERAEAWMAEDVPEVVEVPLKGGLQRFTVPGSVSSTDAI